MTIKARMIADSIFPENGPRISTIEVTMPRFLLAQLNTHRMFSRNSASSRAIPTKRLIESVVDDPVIPMHWGKNQSGMVAEKEFSEDEKKQLTEIWLQARDKAVTYAELLALYGVHKQIVNRILEPFMWHTVIITATEWDNFFKQRIHRDAQPEMRMVAEVIRDCLNTSQPEVREYHIPFIDDTDKFLIESYIKTYGYEIDYGLDDTSKFQGNEYNLPDNAINPLHLQVMISIARCASVSYVRHNETRSIEKDIDLFYRLYTADPKHLSPFEMVAVASEPEYEWTEGCNEFFANFRGWKSVRYLIEKENLKFSTEKPKIYF